MTTSAASPASARLRLFSIGEWLLILGLAATFAWTTLCLGGFLATTMIVTGWGIFGLAALGGLLWVIGRTDLCLNRAVLLPVPFLLYALASVIWLAPAQWLAWREWLLWFQMWLVFALALHFGRGPKAAWFLIGILVALGLTGVAMAGYQRFTDGSWLMLGRIQADQFSGRSSGMFGIPNSLAGLLELMVPVCLVLLFSRSAGVMAKIFCGWLAALFIFGLVLTGSRGGWMGVSLALILWPLLGARGWKKRLAGAVAMVLLATAGGWGLYHYSDYARARLDPFLEGKFEASRPIIWRVGLKIWQDHPWLGSGTASYNVLFDHYRPRGFLNEPQWAHNEYLNTLSDYGIVGFIFWAGAGGALLFFGWRAVQRARREPGKPPDVFSRWQWRLGLLLGLLAFAFHLTVDFHTKIPALAFAAAIVTGLLLRNEPALRRPLAAAWARTIGLAGMAVALLTAVMVAAPLYRAESWRFDSRRSIDQQAGRTEGNLGAVVAAAENDFARAVQIYPADGQAWADYSYARVLGWHRSGPDLATLGREAEVMAERARSLCPVNAEYWVRKGVALDMQARHDEGEICFRRAVELAPTSSRWWFHLAYHYGALAGRKAAALEAVATCLALDPANSAGVTLRQRLAGQN